MHWEIKAFIKITISELSVSGSHFVVPYFYCCKRCKALQHHSKCLIYHFLVIVKCLCQRHLVKEMK